MVDVFAGTRHKAPTGAFLGRAMRTLYSLAMATLGTISALLRREGLLVGVRAAREEPRDDADVAVTGADCDSRFAAPAHLFICKGANFKPAYLARALEAGAVAWLAETALAHDLEASVPAATRVPRLIVCDVRRAMALASAEAWGHPDGEVACLGITGTKGKTTTAHLLRAILRGAGEEPAFMGTHEISDGVSVEETANTTPEAPDLWRHIANARRAGRRHCVMEVSSQGLKYDRTLGLRFAVVGFLNIGNDHISPIEHPTFEDYFSSKLRIFEQAERSVVNLDTPEIERILAASALRPRATVALEVRTGLPEPDYLATEIAPGAAGVAFTAETPAGEVAAELAMDGAFNVSNALMALAMAGEAGFSVREAARALAGVRVPGRMERFDSPDGRLTTIVDYAHNDLSYRRFFETIEASWPNAHVISVFGVSGGKALDRYHDLPAIASEHSDAIILTSDDPGDEDPAELVERIARHVAPDVPFEEIPDREAAVERGFELALAAREGGCRVVLCLLGKGRENGIYAKGRNVPIENDAVHAERLMREAGLLAAPSGIGGEERTETGDRHGL